MTNVSAEEVLERTALYREIFDFTIDPVAEPDRFEALTKELSPRYDGDRQLVRFELERADDSGFTAEQRGVIMRTAVDLEMLKNETPLEGKFDLVIALGAARMANYDRTYYGAESLQSEKAAGKLVVVGSTRSLASGELEAASSYAFEGTTTEGDLVEAAATKVSEEFDMDIESLVVDNPKAHTELIVESAIERFAIQAGQRIAGITTQIYRIPTVLDLSRVGRRHGIETAVAGNPSGLEIIGNRTFTTYNAEIIRALRAVAKTYQE